MTQNEILVSLQSKWKELPAIYKIITSQKMAFMIKRGEFDYNALESLWVLLPYAVYGLLLSCESRDIELLNFVHWL